MNAIKILGRIARRTAKFAAVLTLLAVVAPLAIPVAAWCVSGEDE